MQSKDDSNLRCPIGRVNRLIGWSVLADRTTKKAMFSLRGQVSRHDVRMSGFAHRSSVAEAIAWIDSVIPSLQTEKIALDRSTDRVLAQAITSGVDVPGFRRGMMDGFAVRASDLRKASESEPVVLRVVGDVYPGKPYSSPLSSMHAIRIMTGAPMPPEGDVVIPVEDVRLQDDQIVVSHPVATGKHVGLPGEDVASGTLVLAAGRRIRPQDIGLLSSIGIDAVEVLCKPRVHLITTGNELLPAGTPPKDFMITDANSPMLESLIRRDGGYVTSAGIVPDDPECILKAFQAEVEIIIVSGGSSVGLEDHVPQLLAEHGELGIHGVQMRPSSPLGIGIFKTRLVFLLPGNPVSCLCGYDFFAGRAIRKLTGRGAALPYREQRLPLGESMLSVEGRKDYVRVQIEEGKVTKVMPQGAAMLFSAVRADGFVVITEEAGSLKTGEMVTVYLYEPR